MDHTGGKKIKCAFDPPFYQNAPPPLLISRRRYNPHPDHSRNCLLIRAWGWKWNPRRKVWWHEEAKVEVRRAYMALWWVEEGAADWWSTGKLLGD